jgi:polyferredoxin
MQDTLDLTSRKNAASARVARNQAIRRAVQIAFLLLFLAPIIPVLYERFSHRAAPIFSSWLLPWDPLLLAGHVARRDWSALVIGAPLVLIALTLILGRFFCGWMCPLGTTLDLVRPLAFWRRGTRTARMDTEATDATKGDRLRGARGGRKGLFAWFPANANSHLRYYLLIGVLAAGVLSLQALGLLDPLVIFHRATTALATTVFALQLSPMRAFLALISFIFVAILVLELWQPRFWCRNLCPLGALLSLFSRWSLLNRRVGEACSNCAECRRACPMNAIPLREPHNTDYSDCTFCLECQAPCPKDGITFGFGTLAGKEWRRVKRGRLIDGKLGNWAGDTAGNAPSAAIPIYQSTKLPAPGRYVPKSGFLGLRLSRRQFVGGVAAGAAGLALTPVVGLERRGQVIRPPGALPEAEFVRTCILCQECVRVCTTNGLRPTTWEAGWAAIGTPQLIPRAGACTLNPSCPQRCATVCPVGAILPLPPEQMRLGLAEVEHSLCLAWDQGSKCLVCVEACLVEAAQMYNGRIIVDPLRCTGCGRCENACPVAGSAIRVQPLGAAG